MHSYFSDLCLQCWLKIKLCTLRVYVKRLLFVLVPSEFNSLPTAFNNLSSLNGSIRNACNSSSEKV